MAEAISTFSARDRWFPVVAAGVCAMAAIGLTWAENDKRGLLRWDRPGAFVSAALTDPTSQGRYAITYLDLEGVRSRSGRAKDPVRIPASRLIPAVPGQQQTAAGGSAPTLTTPETPSSQLASLLPQSTPPGAGAGRGSQPPFVPGNLIGGETPFGVVALRPDNPVVPAVPEPAAWLLMILGIGGLAVALRRNAERRLALAENGFA